MFALAALPFLALSLPVQQDGGLLNDLEIPNGADIVRASLAGEVRDGYKLDDEDELSAALSLGESVRALKGRSGGGKSGGSRAGGGKMVSKAGGKSGGYGTPSSAGGKSSYGAKRASPTYAKYSKYGSFKVFKASPSAYAGSYFGKSRSRTYRTGALGLVYRPYGRHGHRYMRTTSPASRAPHYRNGPNDTATLAPDGSDLLPAPTDNSSVVMMTVPANTDGGRMWQTVTAYFLEKCAAQKGRVFALCGDCNATTLDACLDTFVRVYTEERETAAPTQPAAAGLSMAQGGLAMPVALAETAYSETSALPVETGFSKYAWVEFLGDETDREDLAAELASDVATKTDAALVKAAVSDASIIAADSSARALLPSLSAAVAAASAVLALLRAH